MRGADQKQEAMFSYVWREKRVPADHPLRAIRGMVDTVLKEMSPRFARLYAKVGRTSCSGSFCTTTRPGERSPPGTSAV